jgi:biopolymer transport protein ExbB/TolQ
MKGLLRSLVSLILIGLVSVRVASAQQPRSFEIRPGGCPGLRVLDYRELMGASQNKGGKVAVRAHIDSGGNVYKAHVLEEVERSGPDSLWRTVVGIIRTWCYTPGALTADSYLDYLVVVYPLREGGGGYVEINASGLRLAQGWTLDVNHPAGLVRIKNLDESNVQLSEVPAHFTMEGRANWLHWVGELWRQLGLFFQVAFIVLGAAFLASCGWVLVKGNYSWELPPWGKRRSGEKSLDRESAGNAGISNAGEVSRTGTEKGGTQSAKEVSAQNAKKVSAETAEDVKKLWLWAIHRCHLDRHYLPDPLEQERRETLCQLASKSDPVSGDDPGLKDFIGLSPTEAAKPGILYEDMLPSGDDSSSDVRPTLQKVVEWLDEYAKYLKGSPHDKARLDDLTWELWAEPAIDAAIRIAKPQAEQGIDKFKVFRAGLENHKANRIAWWTSQEVDRAVDRALGEILDSRKSTLDWLWAVGAISPLVGLFGTVWGISQAFAKVQKIQEPQLRMAKLAGDINVALSTTIVGLVLAIFAFFLYYLFKGLIERNGLKQTNYFTEITNQL